MKFTDDEIETIKLLIDDRGWEYGLKSNSAKVWALAKRLGMDKYCALYAHDIKS